MESGSTASIKLARGLLLGVLALTAYRAATQPITTEEAYAWDRFVRAPLVVTLAQYDPHHDLLYTLLARRTVRTFGTCEWALRLPALMSLTLYLASVYRLARRRLGTGLLFLAAVALLTANPSVLELYSTARGAGMALALYTCAAALLARPSTPTNLAAACLGLSVAADLSFVVPVMAFAPALWLLARPPQFAERFLIPTVVVPFVLLVIPLSHFDGQWNRHHSPWPQEYRIRPLVETLRRDAGPRRVRIGASPAAAPVLNFYRAHYKLRNWNDVASEPIEAADYYVLAPNDGVLISQRHMAVVFRGSWLTVAR